MSDELDEIKRSLRKAREFGTGLPYEQAAWLIAEVERLRHADSILRKLVAEGHVGVQGNDYWPTDGDSDEHPLDAGELAYLRQISETSDE